MKTFAKEFLEFKAVTNITVEEALTFYRALARFPNNTEMTAIRQFGVDATAKKAVADTLYDDSILISSGTPCDFDLENPDKVEPL